MNKKNNCHYVSKKEAKDIRREIWEILSKTNKGLKKNVSFSYSGFTNRIVGSSKRNMIFQYKNSIYDTDIQIEFNGKKTKDYPVNFKWFFNEELKIHLPIGWTSELSTSVITIHKIVDKIKIHSFDLAILRVNGLKRELNRGKVDDTTSGHNFSWGEMANFNLAYDKWKNAKKNMIISIKETYLNKRCEREKTNINKDDLGYITSSQLFIESVNENT